jgi:hypothetical protein
MSENDADAVKVALGQLAKALAGSKFRQDLQTDAIAAAQGKEIDVEVLPDNLLSTLGAMTDDELRIVALVQQELESELPGQSVAILF